MNAELIDARIREINDAIQMLRRLLGKEFRELNIYEKLSIGYLVIQLVEAVSASAYSCFQVLLVRKLKAFLNVLLG